jgi:CRISPR-associated protein Csy1
VTPSVHLSHNATLVRNTVTGFLHDRLQPKLDKLKDGDEEARQKLLADHQPQNWIADAARRVSQIQQVTHALKFSHRMPRVQA